MAKKTNKTKVLLLVRKYLGASNEKRQDKGYDPTWRFHSMYTKIGGYSFYSAIKLFKLVEEYNKLVEAGEVITSPVKGGYLVGLSKDRPTTGKAKKEFKKPVTLSEFLKL